MRAAASLFVAAVRISTRNRSSSPLPSHREKKCATSAVPIISRLIPLMSGNFRSIDTASAKSCSLPPKYRLISAGFTPASPAISRTVVPSKPLSEKAFRAASINRSRVACASLGELMRSPCKQSLTYAGERCK